MCVIPQSNDDVDVTYVCAYNKERNGIVTSIFSRHVDKSHPIMKLGDDIKVHVMVFQDTQLLLEVCLN